MCWTRLRHASIHPKDDDEQELWLHDFLWLQVWYLTFIHFRKHIVRKVTRYEYQSFPIFRMVFAIPIRLVPRRHCGHPVSKRGIHYAFSWRSMAQQGGVTGHGREVGSIQITCISWKTSLGSLQKTGKRECVCACACSSDSVCVCVEEGLWKMQYCSCLAFIPSKIQLIGTHMDFTAKALNVLLWMCVYC